MEEVELMKLKYPIGMFKAPGEVTPADIQKHIEQLATLPSRLRAEVEFLSNSQLDTPYREGGWTARQVVHHLADSHMNAYIRFKLAVTEETPTINAYKEQLWAEMEDAKFLPVSVSLQLLESIHQRWTVFLKSLPISEFQKAYFHPEKKKNVSLSEAVCSYSWHCNHHLAHITSLVGRMNWKKQ